MVDYIAKINEQTINGKNFDSPYVNSGITCLDGVSIAKSSNKTVSLTSYLPDDGHDYEVIFMARALTTNTSGAVADFYVYSGNTSGIQVHAGYANTRTASTEDTIHTFSLVIKGDNRNIVARNANGTHAFTAYLYARSYRRLGFNNDSDVTNISKIKLLPNNQTIPIGGNNFDGAWVNSDLTLHSNTSIAANFNQSYSLSNYLPKDGQNYLVAITGYGSTGSTSGNSIWIKATTNTDYYVCGCRTRTKSSRAAGGTAIIPLFNGSRSITITNGSTAGTGAILIRGYRRIGNNSSTSNIAGVAIPSTSLVPNVLIHGTPTNSNGVISNFTTTNYLDVIDGKKDNAEYVVCFTTGSATVSRSQSIATAQKWFTVEIPADSWVLCSYNWQTKASVNLFTAQANTTYWLKLQTSGTSKTFSYSTNGSTYTQVASFSDSTVSTSANYPYRLGNHSVHYLLGRAFTGSINLNECYIKVNGSLVWSGMDYQNHYQYGGYNFDSQWVTKSATLYSASSITASTSVNVSLTSYLPNDGYQHEVLVHGYVWTGKTSGNSAELIVNGAITSCYLCKRNTRTSNNFSDAATLIMPVGTNRTMTIRNGVSVATGSVSLTAVAYRRIGTNT